MDDRTPCLVPGCRRTCKAEAASASASILLGAGTGCDAQLEGERYSLRFGAVMRAYSEAMADQIKDAKAIWGIWE